MSLRNFFVIAALFVVVGSSSAAYTTTTPNNRNKASSPPTSVAFVHVVQPKVAVAAASATLGWLLLSTTEPAMASSKAAAQISLNSLPPTTVSVQIQDLPVVGNLLSGTYTKVDSLLDAGSGAASVTISSPKDKIAAIKSILSAGHLEFDVNGLLDTHLDVDIAADQAGVATVRVASPLIPSLPFKNQASANYVASAAATTTTAAKSTKPSDWSSVTNLGSGETYYFNEKTGVTQFEKPDSI